MIVSTAIPANNYRTLSVPSLHRWDVLVCSIIVSRNNILLDESILKSLVNWVNWIEPWHVILPSEVKLYSPLHRLSWVVSWLMSLPTILSHGLGRRSCCLLPLKLEILLSLME